jgi:phage shock protein A
MASIFDKLVTLVRGTGTNIGQTIVDKNAITILEQEVRDATAAITDARNALVKQMGERKVKTNATDQIDQKLKELGSWTQQAIDKGNEALARECASKIAALENERAELQKTVDSMSENISRLEASIKQGDVTIAALKRRIDAVKATEQVQRAQETVSAAGTGANAKVRNALDSLDRISSRQEQHAAELEAANEVASQVGDGGLEQRLAEAGILPGATAADDVLARFKKPGA